MLVFVANFIRVVASCSSSKYYPFRSVSFLRILGLGNNFDGGTATTPARDVTLENPSFVVSYFQLLFQAVMSDFFFRGRELHT